MRLQSLTLENFRNYSSLTLDLSSSLVHLFLGKNGAGKTNLLEAASVLSLTRSCKAALDDDLARFSSTHFRVRGACADDAGDAVHLEVLFESLPRRRKTFFRSDIRQSAACLVGTLPSVIFLPEDLQLFSGPPAERRRFLDQILCQVSPLYLRSLSSFQKFLKQRNALLRSIARGTSLRSELQLWDDMIARPAAAVTLARLSLIETLNVTLLGEMQLLGEVMRDAVLCYERPTLRREQHTLEDEVRGLLQASQEKDLLLEATQIGPHREDWMLLRDDRSVARFSSRGQQRIAMMAMLFTLVMYMELQKGQKPIILLDDVFSELDADHQNQLLTSLSGYQVLLTGTHLPPSAIASARVWHVDDGCVTAA